MIEQTTHPHQALADAITDPSLGQLPQWPESNNSLLTALQLYPEGSPVSRLFALSARNMLARIEQRTSAGYDTRGEINLALDGAHVMCSGVDRMLGALRDESIDGSLWGEILYNSYSSVILPVSNSDRTTAGFIEELYRLRPPLDSKRDLVIMLSGLPNPGTYNLVLELDKRRFILGGDQDKLDTSKERLLAVFEAQVRECGRYETTNGLGETVVIEGEMIDAMFAKGPRGCPMRNIKTKPKRTTVLKQLWEEIVVRSKSTHTSEHGYNWTE